MKAVSCFIEWTWRFQWTWISPEPECCHPVNFVVIGCPRGCLMTPGQSLTTKLTTADEKCYFSSWWRHQMETFSALLAICAGNSPVPGEFPTLRPVTRSFDVYFDLRLHKRFSKQSWRPWFETPSPSLWRHSYIFKRCAPPRVQQRSVTLKEPVTVALPGEWAETAI